MSMFSAMTWSRRPGWWLVITAIIELVLAGIFLAVGLAVPVLRGGFILTAAILGVLGLALLAWGRRLTRGYEAAQRIKSQGVPGQATIVGMRQTGVYMNEQPQVELQLQVTTEMMAAYPVTLREWVPLMLIGTLTSGRPLPVKVDPSDPQRVVIEWESALGGGMPMAGAMPTVGGPAMAGTLPSGGDAMKQHLLANGVPGTARVLSSAPTGQTDAQGRPVFNLMMRVEIEGRPPMQAPALVGVPPEHAEQLEPGDTVPVKADANNPMMMAVDWENA